MAQILEAPALAGSRYRDTEIVLQSAGRKLARRERRTREFVQKLPDSYTTSYRIQQGDRIDLMALEFFGDSRLWWLLVDLNPVLLRDPLKLSPGVEIRLPADDLAQMLAARFA